MPKSLHDPAYCFHKTSGQAYVKLDGRVIYLGKHDSPESRERYYRLLLERFNPASAPSPNEAKSSPLVVELCADYLAWAKTYYVQDGRPTVQVGRIKAVVDVLEKSHGSTLASEFGPLTLKAMQRQFVTAGRSRGYVNRFVAEVKRMFRWATSEERLEPQVFQALLCVSGLRKGRTAAKELPPVRPVTDEMIEATLPPLPTIVADMVRLQRLIGCRPGELCQLRPRAVDRSGAVWVYRPASHKTEHHEKGRFVPIGPRGQAILAAYLNREPEAFCFAPSESEVLRRRVQRQARQSKVQPSQVDRRKPGPRARPPRPCYDHNSYCRAIARGVAKANRQRVKEAAKRGEQPNLLARWKPNQLRHSPATEIRAKFGLEASQVVLGHSKADVTQVYAERDLTLALKVAQEIG